MVKKVALTGGIATGKSCVQAWLAKQGVPVLDADALTHELYASDLTLKANIANTFGADVFENGDTTGAVNRKALGAKVFGKPDKLALLESWIHPKVKAAIEDFYTAYATAPFVVVTIPILYEKNRQHDFNEIWLVYATKAEQRQRLTEHRGLTAVEADDRLASQLPIDEKRRMTEALGGSIINNTGSIDTLHQQLETLLAAAKA